MAEIDREAVNEREACERIAKAMGWVHETRRKDANLSASGWAGPNGEWQRDLPYDFFTDPVAADALMRWLAENDKYPLCAQVFPIGAEKWEVRIMHHQVHASDWKIALALAADAAIQEAGRGN